MRTYRSHERLGYRRLISRKLSVPNAERIFIIRHALRTGFTIEEIFNLTRIDRWFLFDYRRVEVCHHRDSTRAE